jgi:predicted ester cyclase
MSLLKTTITSDWQYIPGASGQAAGLEQMAPMLTDLSRALPDMKISILDVLVHDAMVAVRAKVSGTHSGLLMGIPATSKPVNFAIHSFHDVAPRRLARPVSTNRRTAAGSGRSIAGVMDERTAKRKGKVLK